MTGILFGTGIGPGDPELMTLKAVRLIRENDTIAVPGEKPEESIAYQITDVVLAMEEESGIPIGELRADGGPTRNRYLMQFQSDILNRKVLVPDAEELSGIGAAYAAGRGLGLYGDEVFTRLKRQEYAPKMCEEIRVRKYNGWKDAVKSVLK